MFGGRIRWFHRKAIMNVGGQRTQERNLCSSGSGAQIGRLPKLRSSSRKLFSSTFTVGFLFGSIRRLFVSKGCARDACRTSNNVAVGTPIARHPLTDPGGRFARTGLLKLTRGVSPAGRFASVDPSFLRPLVAWACSLAGSPLHPLPNLRLATGYYGRIRLPVWLRDVLLVVELPYSRDIPSGCAQYLPKR